MKIFFDNKIFINQIHGGPSTYFINLIENLKNYNCDVKLSSLIHLNNYLDQNKKNISDTCFKIPFNKHLAKINFIKKAMHSFSYKSHIKKINEFNPDIIHTTYYDEYFLQKGKSEKVLTVYDLIVEKFPKLYDKDKNFLPKKKSLDFADKIICISKNTKKDLINFYNVNEKKIAVIYLGCPDKKKIIDINTKPFILFVGTRWKYKNFFNLIIAFSQNKKIYKDFNIVCFGGGEFTKNEKNKISDLGINKDKVIQIEGNNNLLYSYYKKASIFVYPTFYEGFGLPILESFLYECPVACSRTSSLTEVAGNGALYFDPNNTENISGIMEEILYSSEKRHKLIIEGNYQLKKFSWSECAKKTLDFYKS